MRRKNSINIKWSLIWVGIHSVSLFIIGFLLDYINIQNEFIQLLLLGFGVTIFARIAKIFTAKKRFIVDKWFIFWSLLNAFTIWIGYFVIKLIGLTNPFLNIVIIAVLLVLIANIIRRFRLTNTRLIVLSIVIIAVLFFGTSDQSDNYFNKIISPEIENTVNAESESTNYKDKISEIKEKIVQEFDPDSEKNMQRLKEENMNAFDYLNDIRKENNVPILKWDERVYNLGIARVKDMHEYNYMDHTNPETGSCPDNIKKEYGLSYSEYVAENAYGMQGADANPISAIDSWMTSRGHRYNLLYPTHIGGAIACYRGYCAFLGLNHDRFGEGCSTGEEGMAFWNSVGKQPGEIG